MITLPTGLLISDAPGSTPAKLAEIPATGPRVIATGGTSRSPVTVRFDQPKRPGGIKIPNLCDSELAETVYAPVYTSSPAITAAPYRKRAVRLRRPPISGDPISVVFHRRPGSAATSALGPLVTTEGGTTGAVLTYHAANHPDHLGEYSHLDDFAYGPAAKHGGDSRRDRLGKVTGLPIQFGPGPRNQYETSLLTFDPEVAATISQKSVSIRPLLWAGYSLAAGTNVFSRSVRCMAPADGVSPEWVQEQLAKLKLGRLWTLAAFTTQVHLADNFRSPLIIDVVAKNTEVFVTVSGTFGRVSGAASVTPNSLGEPVYMYGPSSGLTEGHIHAVDAYVDGLAYNRNAVNSTAAFEGWFVVKGKYAGHPFSRPGDSNSSVYTRDREDPTKLSVCGMVVAGVVVQEGGRDSIYTLVQPIQPCLDHWKAKLLGTP